MENSIPLHNHVCVCPSPLRLRYSTMKVRVIVERVRRRKAQMRQKRKAAKQIVVRRSSTQPPLDSLTLQLRRILSAWIPSASSQQASSSSTDPRSRLSSTYVPPSVQLVHLPHVDCRRCISLEGEIMNFRRLALDTLQELEKRLRRAERRYRVSREARRTLQKRLDLMCQ